MLGKYDENGIFHSPLFPIEICNDFPLVAFGIPTTTNAVEDLSTVL